MPSTLTLLSEVGVFGTELWLVEIFYGAIKYEALSSSVPRIQTFAQTCKVPSSLAISSLSLFLAFSYDVAFLRTIISSGITKRANEC